MKRTLLCILLSIIAIFSFTFVACKPSDGDKGPVANAELDEYNQIVDTMKNVFTKNTTPTETASANCKIKANGTRLSSSRILCSDNKQNKISNMFTIMNDDSTKQETDDMDYYAYGIDFSTMTARIAGYAANNFFKVSSFYGLNILMDYGGNTIINAVVNKEGNTIKTYLYTTFKNSNNQLLKEYDYTEINFTSESDFNILVVDYVYNEQGQITSQAMVYASSDKDFFFLSGDVENPKTSIVFFDMGDSSPAYVLQGEKTNSISNLYAIMAQDFALSSQDKSLIGGLYNNQQYSISYNQVVKAKKDLGIIIDMEDEEYVPPKGFVSNKNAEDLMGRKTLQAFVDDGVSVNGTTLTIPKDFSYLSGGIQFNANIDTLVIPSTIKGVVVYDIPGNYSILDDSLCYYEPGNNYDGGSYRAWGGELLSFTSTPNNEFHINNIKPFKKYILLDDNGNEVKETDAFILDEVGNLWIKDSKGNKNYLWGFVSEPLANADTLYLPSPTHLTKGGKHIEVERFYGVSFMQSLKNVNKVDEYSAHFKHLIIDGYEIQSNPGTEFQSNFKLLNTPFLTSFENEDGTINGFKWNFDTLTINNIVDNAIIDLSAVFCSVSNRPNKNGIPTPKTICQTKIKKVILNGDFKTITYINGYCEIDQGEIVDLGGGVFIEPNGEREVKETYAISEDYELNGRENAGFTMESVIYGKKVVEIYENESGFPSYPNAETLIIKSSVEELSLYNSILTIGVYPMPKEQKLTIEFENISNVNFSSFYIYDLMWEGSNRVEKIKFNSSNLFIKNFIKNLEWNPSADWLKEIITLDKYTIEYANALPGEEEFLTNFEVDNYGYVQLKEDVSLTTFQIDDEFLNLVKFISGKEFSEITIDFIGYNNENTKIVVNVSQEFFNLNKQIPKLIGATTVEISSQMYEFKDLTVILDRIEPNNKAKLIFNGTKQETVQLLNVSCEYYIEKLLYSQCGYYDEIIFSDNQVIYGNLINKTFTYEDNRIKIVATFNDSELVESYYFLDKENDNVYFTNENGLGYGTDNQNDWYATIRLSYDGILNTFYYNDCEIIVPSYVLSIYYHYGHKPNGDLNDIYGNIDNPIKKTIKLYDLSENETIE